MNPLDILYVAGGAWLAAAVAGLLAGSWRPGLRACCILSGLGGAAAAAGGGWSLVYGNTPVVTPGGASATIVGGPLQLQATSLAGVFVALLGIVAVAIAWYAPRYHEPARGTAVYLAAYNLALLACLGVLTAGGMVTFLVAWESMSLACYLVILRHPRSDESARGAFWFLALSEIGFLLIVAAFVILSAKTHATQLDLMAARSHLVPGGWRAAAYLLALAGFGCKAGLVPLHVWLPEAHPVAPADGSAFLSGVVVNLGVYGIALFAFQLDPVGGAWPGLVTMGAGAVTAAIGILYALRERDIKRFLAYSTIENSGIIVTAFGAAMIFHAYRQQALWAFLLIAGLYHVANHGCYKTLLFLEAGVVEHATGTRDMDRLGGLVHRLPRSAVITFVGTLGIAALPPLNGFVSEWLIFQGLFQGFRTGSHLIAILIVLAAATLGLTGGLAIYAFVRGFGIPYLGMPRTRQAAATREKGQPIAGPALLAVACVALAVGRPGHARGAVPYRPHGHRGRARAAAAARQAHRHPGPRELLRVLADLPGRISHRRVRRSRADLPGRTAAGRERLGPGLGRRHRQLPAADAVLGHDILRSHPGHLRRPVPARSFPSAAPLTTTRRGGQGRCTTKRR